MSNELTKEDIGWLNDLIVKNGWSIYKDMLNTQLNSYNLRLRKSRQDEKEYNYLCGVMDGIEKAMNIVDQEIKEFEAKNDQ